MSRAQKLLFWLVLLMMAAVIVWLAWDLLQPQRPVQEIYQEPEDGRITVDGTVYLPKSNLEPILLIGVDNQQQEEASFQNHLQCDFVTLLLLDHGEKTMTLLQLNRDTMCEIPVLDTQGNRVGYRNAQLALAHTYGTGGKDSCLNTVKTVSALLYGTEILEYASVPVQGMAAVNDAVGGVEVLVEDDFSAIDPALVQGQRITLTGRQAETFIRSRGGMEDSSNIARMARQREYMQGFVHAVASCDNRDVLAQRLAQQLADQLVSNLSVSRMAQIADCAATYSLQEIVVPAGESRKGERYMEFYLDEDAFRQTVLELFYRPKSA